MERAKLQHFKEKLIDEKKKVLRTLNNMTNMEEYGSMDNYYNELSQYDNHPADVGTEVFMREQDEGFKNNFKNQLREIEDSLKDIKEGNYGICKNCNKEIKENRLEAIPYVKTCLECSEELSNSTNLFESIDDDYITSYSQNKEGELIFDREDTYQELAQMEMVPGDPSFSTGDYIGVTDEQNESDEIDVENISQEYYDETLK
ncbi:TraR/DksA C4-type zinc finger protein [Tissierella sp. Yu-01]|uniref:TraR/DksA C4-type zinc finger protein n=1 Tax=Tissierella sp. Yu-01 TaxID=3035694 RepID=UPI00240D923C|nr:TraR/DksA C4-type zinc finger protein [Tissierella sp. Yu-01]WFA09827.1 TraR/DksA C4-type zinc finger protein [Tissierella sp. Yu-01]